MEALTPELVPIADLVRHPQNPRRGDVEGLRGLIRENGWVGVVFRQKSTGYVLKGWHSSQAALAEGYAELPVVTLDVDDARAKAILFGDNRGSELGTMDDGDLAALVQDLMDDGVDLEALALTDDDVDSILRASGAFGDDASAFLAGIGQEGDSDDADDADEDTGDDDGDDSPAAPPAPSPKDTDEPVYFQLGYTVTMEQRQTILDAIKAAKTGLGDEATSAACLTEICREYLAGA